MSKITVVYLRTPMDGINMSSELMRQYWREYAKQQGYANLIIYEDCCRMMESIYSRPEMKKLNEDIEQGEVERVLVKAVNVLGRNFAETMQWIRWVREKGVSLFFMDNNMIFRNNPENAEDNANQEKILELFYALAEAESHNKNKFMLPP